jgi:hypothetical protein
MKTKIQSLAFAALLFGSLALSQTARAAHDGDHAALAAKYDKLAATQQAVLDQCLKLKAAVTVPKGSSWAEAYAALASAASHELADFQRYAKWHRLEASGAADRADALIAEQQAVIDANLKLKAEGHAGYVNAKLTPSGRTAAREQGYDAKIAAARGELADLKGFAQWHQLAEAGAAEEAAKLSADQQAVVQEHQKMKADSRFGYVNEKLTPGSRYAEMDQHCDALIAAAQQQLSLLQEFAQR